MRKLPSSLKCCFTIHNNFTTRAQHNQHHHHLSQLARLFQHFHFFPFSSFFILFSYLSTDQQRLLLAALSYERKIT
jgi:hypothetical protein